ncbi:WD repeat-containing protein 78, partial [Cladochytrium tenue]
WPERIYRADSPACTIDFSRTSPNLLAAGFASGRMAIYDVRRPSSEPILDNGNMAGKHRDPLWELRWVERSRGIGDDDHKAEAIVSVSTDGRVSQWTIKKGLQHNDIMLLKRVAKQQEGNGRQEGTFVARQSGGFSLDFHRKDPSLYLVGTEDGHIHHCSASYNEQYLSTHSGHAGAVYRVRWSPFHPAMFLSASADWSAMLWETGREAPLFRMQGGKDAVCDIAWSPCCSTMFGCVTNEGQLEIWDLSYSVLDPVASHTLLDRKLTSILFSLESRAVLVGDDQGVISVFTLQTGTAAALATAGAAEDMDITAQAAMLPLPPAATYATGDDEWMRAQADALERAANSKDQGGAVANADADGTAPGDAGGSGASL